VDSAAKESNKEKPPKKPTSVFLSLMPQVHPTDKKPEVRTFLGFATALSQPSSRNSKIPVSRYIFVLPARGQNRNRATTKSVISKTKLASSPEGQMA